MLSESHTINDVKIKLPSYTFFSYDNVYDFEDRIISISEDVMRLYFYPRLGTAEYNRIAAKDKVSLTTSETNLYWAEVYAICYEFIEYKNVGSSSSAQESLTVEGYSFKTSSTTSGITLENFKKKMYDYFRLVGFDLFSLERTCTIFGGNDYPNLGLLEDE